MATDATPREAGSNDQLGLQVTDWIPFGRPPIRVGWYDVLLHNTGEVRRVRFQGMHMGLWIVAQQTIAGWTPEGGPMCIDTSYVIPRGKASWRGLARRPNVEVTGAQSVRHRSTDEHDQG